MIEGHDTSCSNANAREEFLQRYAPLSKTELSNVKKSVDRNAGAFGRITIEPSRASRKYRDFNDGSKIGSDGVRR